MSCACTIHTHSDNEHHHDHHPHDHGASWNKKEVIRFGLAAVFFIAGIALTVTQAPFDIAFSSQSAHISIPFSVILFLSAWLFAGFEVFHNLITTVGKGSIFDENFLMTFATIGAFILGEWTEGAAVMIFFNLGELLQGAAVQQSRRAITNLMDLRPEKVRLYQSPFQHEQVLQTHQHTGSESCYVDHDHTDETEEQSETTEQFLSPQSVPVGTLILVKAGEKVPLDGVLVEGACSFDTSSMTGESVPRFIKQGENVLAGFLNLDGLAVIRTTADADETAAAKMLALVEEAQNRKAKTERLISAFARVYTPIVTAAACLLAIFPPFVLLAVQGTAIEGWQSFAPWFERGLVFLVISCPCAFVIAVPLGYFGGLGGAAKKGILIKGADFIDSLAKTETVVFDKTGTLTEGILSISEVIPAEGIDINELLSYAYSAEYHSNHPIAKAVKQYAEESLKREDYPTLYESLQELHDYTETAGKGLSVNYRGKELKAGSPAFIFGLDSAVPSTIKQAEGVKVCFSYGNSYLGYILCTDSIKTDSAQAVKTLRNAGVQQIEMLTGDNTQTAQTIADSLGLDGFRSKLLPHEKVSQFEQIRNERKAKNNRAVCAFVGDGINDAPVLARADVGIAMGALGSDAAIEAADVVLMNDNPLLIATAIKKARFTRKIVKENIVLAFAIKLLFLGGGALGFIGLWAAVFADVGVALLAVCNSLRARS